MRGSMLVAASSPAAASSGPRRSYCGLAWKTVLVGRDD